MTAAELCVLGFADAGTCSLDARLKSGVRFAITASKDVCVIYAFAVDDEVKYIGVCDNSGTCFAHRMSRYQGMMGAGTNKRIVGHLREALTQGSAVRLLSGVPSKR